MRSHVKLMMGVLLVMLVAVAWLSSAGAPPMTCVNPATGYPVNIVVDYNRECDAMGPCAGLTSAVCTAAGTNCLGFGVYPFRSIALADIGAVGTCTILQYHECKRCPAPAVIVCARGRAYQNKLPSGACAGPCPSWTYWSSAPNACRD